VFLLVIIIRLLVDCGSVSGFVCFFVCVFVASFVINEEIKVSEIAFGSELQNDFCRFEKYNLVSGTVIKPFEFYILFRQ